MSEAILLEANEITKSFGGVHAVENVSIAVREGTIHALIGPNGAGKTTFFNTISGFTFPDHGQVTFRDTDVTRTKNWRRVEMGMGRTFQTPSVFPELTARVQYWSNVDVPLTDSVPVPANVIPDASQLPTIMPPPIVSV